MSKSSFFLILTVLCFAGIHCQAQVITTIAGIGTSGLSGDGGPATAAALAEPYCVATDHDGNVYVGDYGTARVRKISRAGILTTVAGNGTFANTGDGGPATAASVFGILSIAVDASHNLYIVDGDSRVVRKVDAAGIISTFAGNGTTGYSGDGGPATAAQFNFPSGIAFDDAGNAYIADDFNQVVRKINTAGIISTFVGTGIAGYSGDGGAATAAALHVPTAVATDHSGNVYIADGLNNVVRKVSPAGIIHTVAGNGAPGYSGDGGPATSASISDVVGLAIDPLGNLIIPDGGNNVVRKVDAAGIITTIAGNGFGAGGGTFSGGFSGDGGPADSAQLNEPDCTASDAIGNMYIADHYNSAVRKVSGISGSNHICIGDSVIFHPQVTGGVWASSMPGIAHVNPASGAVRGDAAGTAVIYYSIGTDTATATVYVNALPSAGIITGTHDSVCMGTIIALADTVAGGIWSLANANATIAASGKVTPALPGNDTALYKVSYTCGIAISLYPFTMIRADAGTITGLHTICVGDTITFTDSAPGGVWTIGDPTTASFVAPGVVRTTAPGFNEVEYTVTTTIPGCTATAFFDFHADTGIHCTTTGISSVPLHSGQSRIYPNPSTHTLYVEMTATNECRNITISNMYGSTVYTTTVTPNTTKAELNLSLPPGIYMLNIQGNTTAELHKLVIE